MVCIGSFLRRVRPHCLAAFSAIALAGCTAPATPAAAVSSLSCNRVVLTGYWPPTNEMLRQWSTNPQHNPGQWQGRNWRGLGYDVYSFFPEFPPDGDPVGDPIGSPGSVGSVGSDLQVDFQATSQDFWRIMDEHQPRVLITTSRGGDIDWELEAIEGGHSGAAESAKDRADEDWRSDAYGPITTPAQASVDPRSWQAITTYRNGVTLGSQLPLAEILTATQALQIANVEIDQTGTSGNYLSGFMGLHGLFYNQQTPSNVAAGHIHVGKTTSVAVATQLMETTLATVLKSHPPIDCATR